MTREEVAEICGDPDDIEKMVLETAIIESWIYYYEDDWLGKRPDLGSCSVVFEDGRVKILKTR